MEELLRTEAWKVQESPVDLGYRAVPDWPQIPEGWVLGQVAGVEADSQNRATASTTLVIRPTATSLSGC